jgi:integrase
MWLAIGWPGCCEVLTRTLIDRATPQSKRFVIWDRGLPGFGCRVSPSGRRIFVVSYRMPDSRRAITATLGAYGVLTLEQARDMALKLLAKVRDGGDPRAEKRERGQAEARLSVTQLVLQYADALRTGTAFSKRLKGRPASQGYVEDTLHYLRLFTSACGQQAAASVTRSDVVRVLNGYVRRPATYRHLHGAISRLYGWARRHEMVDNDPANDIETATAPARERVLSLAELVQVWRAAEQLEPLYRDLVQLMVLTGQRRTEVAGMRWGEVDLARGVWTLPAARTKARRQHAIPLPRLAVACLQARRNAFRRSPQQDDLVLPTLGRDGRTIAPISGWNWLKRELDRRTGIPPWRLHDFRRSLVTILAERGIDIALLDSLLNHAASVTRAGVIGVYQKASLIEPMRQTMAIWDDLLTKAVEGGRPQSEKVVRLPQKKA